MHYSTLTPNVTILIPVYNAEAYLRECLLSVLNQTLSNMEVICINDGSNDRSLDIMERIAQNDERIIILNKDNSGYGDSLNHGLERARGNYIGIIESDDFVDKDMFRKLYALAIRHNADIVKSDFFEYKQGISRKANIITAVDANRLISPCVDFAIFRAQPSIWSAIYRRSFLEENCIGFTDSTGASFQDTAFNLKTLATSDRVWLTSDAFVHYRRDNEYSSIHSNEKVFAVCDEYDSFERYMEQYPGRLNCIRLPLQAVRFETYSWNLSRLSGEAQLTFYEHMYEKFRALQDEGLISTDDFAPGDRPLLELLLSGDQKFITASIEARIRMYAHNDL